MAYTIFKPNGKKLYYNNDSLYLVKFCPEYNEEKERGIKYKIFGGTPGAAWQYYLYQVKENNVLYDVFESFLTREWFVSGTAKLNDRLCGGVSHRENGPSFEHYQDYDVWHKNGKRHRVGGPAYQKGSDYKDGEEWYFKDKLHREDGPAVIIKNEGPTWDGSHWYINGKKHRLDGPAVELDSGIKKWYYQDEEVICSSQEEFEKMINLKAFW